ncbi:HNH endonuclease signature motif containing protein [Glutamicibacter sp. 363]|uniref:HNH endonuclease signature motif containing protein n=1 Tax=unclassified Glutamicibacter TaxID=2627139 RepID=UPI0040340F8A
MDNSRSTAEALGQLARGLALMTAATQAIAAETPAPGHAAYFAWLTERAAAAVAHAQIHAADALRRSGAHKLDQQSLQKISDAGSQTAPEELDALHGQTTTGRTQFKATAELLHGWLGVPATTARERLVQADCLIAGVDEAGQRLDPWLPQLAEQFADPAADPRLVVGTAKKIHAARNDLGQGAEGEAAKARLQAEAVSFIKNEPETARKHVADLVAQVKAGKRPMKALLADIGFFKLGVRNGLVEYLLRVLPAQAAQIEAFQQALNNPKTIAGNREALKDLDAELTGEPGSAWDDSDSMPGWAKGDADAENVENRPAHAEPGNDATEPAENDEPGNAVERGSAAQDEEPAAPAAEAESRPADLPGGCPAAPALPGTDAPRFSTPVAQSRDAEDLPDSAVDPPDLARAGPEAQAPWEELRPERRYLIGFMALLMADRTGSGGSKGKRPGLVAPQVSIILDYEKMRERGKDFAVTSSGIELSAGETRAALCNAGVYPLVLNGKSLPLDLGRTQRLFSKAQGRAIRAAYRGCAYPGCSMPAERCELDHLDAWEKGGATDVESSELGCSVHHIERHCGLFHAVKIKGCRPMVLLSKELDPQQRLRVNTFFMTPSEALEAEELAQRMTRLWRAGQLDVEIVDP